MCDKFEQRKRSVQETYAVYCRAAWGQEKSKELVDTGVLYTTLRWEQDFCHEHCIQCAFSTMVHYAHCKGLPVGSTLRA
jgi:hypothetical protein